MHKQCVNCPGAVDHSTAECPIAGREQQALVAPATPGLPRYNAPRGTTLSESDKGELVMAADHNAAIDALRTQVAELQAELEEARGLPTAPAVVKQQVTTAACLWKREQDSGFYETGCGQTWHFTDGSTPDENSAYFCHHCGNSLEVQRLVAYQVGDNDIVAAYDPAGAIEVLCTYNGYELDEFTVDEVVAVSDALLDSTEAFDQDEGKTVPLEKTLRQELEELTEPAYLHGWE